MNYTLEQIEDAVIAHLKKELPYLRDVATYEDEVDQQIQKGQFPLPAVFVEVDREDYEAEAEYGDAPATAWVTPNINIYMVAHSLRGKGSAKRYDKGIYAIHADVKKALWGQRIPLAGETALMVGVDTFRPSASLQQLAYYNEFAVYLAPFGMRYLYDVQEG